MRLVSIEGLPKSCSEIMRILQQQKEYVFLSSPIMNTHASRCSKGDDLATIFSSVLSKINFIQRNAPETTVMCCSHWLYDTQLPLREKFVLHGLVLELLQAVAQDVGGLGVEHHTMVFLRTSVHECFATLLEELEAKDICIHNLLEHQSFLDTLASGGMVTSPFPCSIRVFQCPPFQRDNHIDALIMSSKIAALLKT